MNELLQTEDFSTTEDLIQEMERKFSTGTEMVHVARDNHIIGMMLSPSATKQILSMRVADRLISDPYALSTLAERLEEEPVSW